MANTERLKVMGAVHDAKLAVEDALASKDWPTAQRKAIESVANKLAEIEDDLFGAELESRVGKLENDSSMLSRLNKKLERDIAGLKTVARRVAEAAQAVKILVQIAELAAKL